MPSRLPSSVQHSHAPRVEHPDLFVRTAPEVAKDRHREFLLHSVEAHFNSECFTVDGRCDLFTGEMTIGNGQSTERESERIHLRRRSNSSSEEVSEKSCNIVERLAVSHPRSLRLSLSVSEIERVDELSCARLL